MVYFMSNRGALGPQMTACKPTCPVCAPILGLISYHHGDDVFLKVPYDHRCHKGRAMLHSMAFALGFYGRNSAALLLALHRNTNACPDCCITVSHR